jgi:glucose/arabinose dehydrogenase
MYASESGQPKYGELNVIVKGKNYGWPKADGPGSDAALTNPLFSWPIADSCCSGVAGSERRWPPRACSASGSGCST